MIHQKNVKVQHVVAIGMAEQLKANGFNVVPGLKFCRKSCKQSFQHNEMNMESSVENEELEERIPRYEDDSDKTKTENLLGPISIMQSMH